MDARLTIAASIVDVLCDDARVRWCFVVESCIDAMNTFGDAPEVGGRGAPDRLYNYSYTICGFFCFFRDGATSGWWCVCPQLCAFIGIPKYL